jgi:hypothetical protein
MLRWRRAKNAKSVTSTKSGKHTTINFSHQPGWFEICMLINRRKRLWMTCLQSCQGVARQTRLLWMSCQSCMEGVKTGSSQRRISKTCKSYVSIFCVIATNHYVWLQTWLCLWLKILGYLWLQAWIVLLQPDWVITKYDSFVIAKSLNNISSQLFFVCDCN